MVKTKSLIDWMQRANCYGLFILKLREWLLDSVTIYSHGFV